MDANARDHNLLRQMNIALVAGLLRRRQPISRVELADRAGLGRSTITGIISLLIREGLAVEVGEAESTGGRKPVLLELVPRQGLVVCIRLTPRTVALGLADLSGRLVARHRRALRGERSPDEVLDRVATWTMEMLREFGPGSSRVVAAGMVLPGRVDADRGVVLDSPVLGWQAAPVGPTLRERLGMPVLIDHEGNAFTVGERLQGAGRKADDLLGVTVGASVRGGLILDGQLCRGAAGGVGEVGHMLIDPDGPPCQCGRHGCLEALVCDGALVSQALAALDRGAHSLLPELVEGRLQAITREVIVAAAQDHDRLCIRLLEQAGHRIGTAVVQLANALGPQAVVLGGEAVDQAGPLLLGPARATIESRLVPWMTGQLRVEGAALGETALLTGAAEMVLERVFRLPSPLDPPGPDPLSIANWLPEES